MTTHLEENLQRDRDRLRALITNMSEFAIRMLRECVGALERKDRQTAALIILRDQRVDQMEEEIDRLCLEFLVRHQPAGAHLRFAYAVLLISFELERIGDYAESIARQTIKLIDLECRLLPGLFADITSASISMLQNAVTAFARQDAHLAEVTELVEEQVDGLRNQASSELMHLVQSNQIPLAALTPLMTIARRFERVSDQAKSICQETIYLCTGEYAKHVDSHVYRVLFVDDHHGCLSRMAEAIGHRLGRSDFEFASAGIEPQPLAPIVLSFLRERSVPIEPQNRLSELPQFERYHLVIALSAAARKQLPAPPRKTMQLEWSVADLDRASGSPEQVRQACEAAYSFLSQKILEVVQTLSGEEKTKP